MVLADSDRITRVPPYLGTLQRTYKAFRLRGCHPLWPDFPDRFSYAFWFLGLRQQRPATPKTVSCFRFGLIPVRSPLLGESLLFYFPQGTEMFHFPWFASSDYEFIEGYTEINRCGFPHSEIHGS